jgi:hypothetical protein
LFTREPGLIASNNRQLLGSRAIIRSNHQSRADGGIFGLRAHIEEDVRERDAWGSANGSENRFAAGRRHRAVANQLKRQTV